MYENEQENEDNMIDRISVIIDANKPTRNIHDQEQYFSNDLDMVEQEDYQGEQRDAVQDLPKPT